MLRILVPVIAVAAGLPMTACAGDTATESATGVDWYTKSWMQPAGTPMVEGLDVPEGAWLVGPVFTHVTESKSGQVTVDRQSALLLAESGIDQIADEVAHQAAPPRVVFMYSGVICSQEVPAEWSTEDDPQTDYKEYSGTADADAVALLCAGYQRSRPGLEMDLRQDLTKPDSPVQGHLRWFSPDDDWPHTLPVVPSAEQDGPTTVPTNVAGDPDLPIADGSFLAGPPGWGSGTGGFTAVIGVTGDPDEVFDDYLRYQMKEPPKADEYMLGNLRVRQGTTGGAGGVTYTVTLNEIDGNAWILVEAYND